MKDSEPVRAWISLVGRKLRVEYELPEFDSRLWAIAYGDDWRITLAEAADRAINDEDDLAEALRMNESGAAMSLMNRLLIREDLGGWDAFYIDGWDGFNKEAARWEAEWLGEWTDGDNEFVPMPSEFVPLWRAAVSACQRLAVDEATAAVKAFAQEVPMSDDAEEQEPGPT